MGKKRLQNRIRLTSRDSVTRSVRSLASGFALPPHPFLISFLTSIQRELNDLYRTRISRRHIICPPPPPPPFCQISQFYIFLRLPVFRRSRLLTNDDRGGAVGGEAKSYDGEKIWSSIHHSILSASICTLPPPSSPLLPIAVVGMIKINTEEPLFLTSIVGDGCICRPVVNSGKSKPLLQYIYSYSTTVVLLRESVFCVLCTVYIQALVTPYGRVRKLTATYFLGQCTFALNSEPSQQLQYHKTIATRHHRVLTPPPPSPKHSEGRQK